MSHISSHSPRRFPRRLAAIGGSAAVGVAVLLGQATPAAAAQPPVGLGTAESYAVLAGSTVTNTGATTISGDVGVSPGSTTPGLTEAMVSDGTIHRADANAASAQDDTTTAYNSAAERTPRTAVPTELGGRTLFAGVYSNDTLAITGTLTLDAQGDPSAVFVFQTDSTLLATTSSRVVLTNGADACRVYWQVGSSATLATDSTFVGTVLALTSITADTRASVRGRLLARNGAVTLDDNDIRRPDCAAAPPTTGPTGGSTSATPTSTPTTTGSATPTAPSTGTTAAGPTAGELSPSSGPESGGTVVSVSGTGFVRGRTTVTIGDTTVPARDVRVTSPTDLTFRTPSHTAGRTTVTISTPRGTTRTGLTFTYTGRTRTPLANTGTDETGLAVGGVALLLAGGLVLQLAKKRTSGRHAH